MKTLILCTLLSFSFVVSAQEAASAPEERAMTSVEKFKQAMAERKAKKEEQ